LSIRSFLGLEVHEAPPDHSTVSRTRRLIDLETHQAVFTWVLHRLADAGLVKGKTIGIDATTLEANAALRSIVRRDTGETYDEFLTRLAQASGIATPTRKDLARIDRTRKHKGSNDDWTHPHDPDAKIRNMKVSNLHRGNPCGVLYHRSFSRRLSSKLGSCGCGSKSVLRPEARWFDHVGSRRRKPPPDWQQRPKC
jgi:hypothetical protein